MNLEEKFKNLELAFSSIYKRISNCETKLKSLTNDTKLDPGECIVIEKYKDGYLVNLKTDAYTTSHICTDRDDLFKHLEGLL